MMLRSGVSMRGGPRPDRASARAADLLHEARQRELAGCIPEAGEQYEAAIAAATGSGDRRTLAEALRRLAVLRYHHNEPDAARALATRSHKVAEGCGNDLLAAEALNTLATLDLQIGHLDRARTTYQQALAVGGRDREFRARVEQNLGILANIHGDLAQAVTHYRSSLDAFAAAGNEHGCAISYHNLGMVSADRAEWDEADRYFTRSRSIADRCGDAHLQGLCLVNHADVMVARGHFDDARRAAEAALALFDQLDARPAKADAYRVIGMVFRETGRHSLAESRLKSAMELAVRTGSVLSEAEAARELAVLYQAMGRNQDALSLLNTAYRLFQRLDARVDLVNVGGKVESLERTYMAVVQQWGESIESSDSYTHGHCERVATYAVGVAQMLGMSEADKKTIRVGAYLHDVGKMRVPHEILNKPGPLTEDEFALMRMHTIWGVELLAGIEFPWEIVPIVRWHHEKYDGTGYPDRLAGDEIPLNAQVIGIVDVYDALTTTRAYRPALSHDDALAEICRCSSWWRADVVEAFLTSVGGGTRTARIAAA